MNTLAHKQLSSATTSKTNRFIVSKLAQHAQAGIISIRDAAKVLGWKSRDTALRLASLARIGWLQRARRGLYLILPLEVEPGRIVAAEDPWVLAQEAFSPCYIGGWSAAEHWGLTEQTFRTTLVITSANVRARDTHLAGSDFRLFRVPKDRLAGAERIWRGRVQILASSRERTIADCLRSPELCGGGRMLAQMFREYTDGPEFNGLGVAREIERIGNGAAWKRFGYLIELARPNDRDLLRRARARLTSGNVKFDPLITQKGRLTRRWGLWVNVADCQVSVGVRNHGAKRISTKWEHASPPRKGPHTARALPVLMRSPKAGAIKDTRSSQ